MGLGGGFPGRVGHAPRGRIAVESRGGAHRPIPHPGHRPGRWHARGVAAGAFAQRDACRGHPDLPAGHGAGGDVRDAGAGLRAVAGGRGVPRRRGGGCAGQHHRHEAGRPRAGHDHRDRDDGHVRGGRDAGVGHARCGGGAGRGHGDPAAGQAAAAQLGAAYRRPGHPRGHAVRADHLHRAAGVAQRDLRPVRCAQPVPYLAHGCVCGRHEPRRVHRLPAARQDQRHARCGASRRADLQHRHDGELRPASAGFAWGRGGRHRDLPAGQPRHVRARHRRGPGGRALARGPDRRAAGRHGRRRHGLRRARPSRPRPGRR